VTAAADGQAGVRDLVRRIFRSVLALLLPRHIERPSHVIVWVLYLIAVFPGAIVPQISPALTGKPSRGRANETTDAAGRDRGVGDGLTGPPRVTRWKGDG
jgi:hypothetical protein